MPKPWTVRRTRVLLDRSPWLRVLGEDIVLPNGVEIEDFLRLEARGYAMVCALTPDARVVLVEQYRMSVHDVCLELPAGGLSTPDEDPLGCAQRELLEETGYAAPHWMALGAYAIDANRGMGQGHLFLAREAERVAEQRLDATEEMLVHLVALPVVRRWLAEGRFRTLATVAALGLALARLE
jgi:ADP-ribose pyrophosphatase